MTAGIDIGPTRKRSAPQGCQAQAGRTSTSLFEQYHVASPPGRCLGKLALQINLNLKNQKEYL